jgi:hypothetical protein
MKDNQQTNLKEPSHTLHYTTQRTHARLFLERGASLFPSFPQLSGKYEFEFEFEFEFGCCYRSSSKFCPKAALASMDIRCHPAQLQLLRLQGQS